MMQIVEINEELLNKVPHIIKLLYELFGEKQIGLFAVLVDGELGFIGRDGVNCVYIHKKGYNRFTLNEKEEVGAIGFNDFDAFFGDTVYFVSHDKKDEYYLSLVPLPEPDIDGYDGCVIFNQYNPANDTFCDIRYQHMYRERDGRPVIYGFHTQKIDSVYIDEQFTKKGSPMKGLLPNRSKYYTRVEFDNTMVGYKLAGIREYGLLEFLEKGPYGLQMDANVIRYARAKYIDCDGNLHDLWPFGEQLKKEELETLISDYGFRVEPASDYIEITNGQNSIVNTIHSLAREMKIVSEEARRDSDTKKCALLTLKKE